MNATDNPAPIECAENDDQEPPIEHLPEEELRSRIRRIDDEMARWRAKLSLLLNSAVQYELDRVGGEDGVEIIASVAGIPASAAYSILAGTYRATPVVWTRLERILMLCHAIRGVERVAEAHGYFRRLLVLTAEKDRALNRRMELSRLKRGKEAGIGTRRKSLELDARRTDADEGTKPAEPDGVDSDTEPDPPFTPPAIPDLRGHDQRPDPLLTRTPAKFVAAMRAYHAWAGNPSLREMERRCAKQISYSTFRTMLHSDSIPAKLSSVETFVRVLGGTTEDLQRWASAWRQIAMHTHGPDEEIEGAR